MPSNASLLATIALSAHPMPPPFGIIFGRLEDDSRFIANTPKDIDLMLKMTTEDFLGVSGNVKNSEGINIFTPK